MPTPPRRPPAWLPLLVAAIAVLAAGWFIGNLRKHRSAAGHPPVADRRPSDQRSVAEDLATLPPIDAPQGVSSAPATDSSSTTITLRVLLARGPSGAPPGEGMAVLQVGRISPEAIADYNEYVSGGRRGAGPSRLEDLATYGEEIALPPPPAVPGEGPIILGPIDVPRAAIYRVLAWNAAAEAWLGDATSRDVAADAPVIGPLAVVAPTGLRITLASNAARWPAYDARLVREPHPADPEPASRLALVTRRQNAEVASAQLDGTRILLPAEGTAALVPLVPDPAVTIELSSPAGHVAAPLRLPLQPGVVRDVTIDLAQLFPDREQGLHALNGRLLWDDGAPAEGVRIRRLNAPDPEPQLTGPGGAFHFGGLPTGADIVFEASPPPPTGGARPIGPDTTRLTHRLDRTPPDGEATAEWRLPRYRWLVVALDAAAREELRRASVVPYPVYFLQRRGAAGWDDIAATEFREEPTGVAVSLVEAGEHRIGVARSPWSWAMSASTSFGPGGGERVVAPPAPVSGRRVTLLLSWGDEAPMSREVVWIGGPHRSLPPIRRTTGPDGSLVLDDVTVDRLSVTAQARGEGVPMTREVVLPAVGAEATVAVPF